MKYLITEKQLKNLRLRRNMIEELPKYIRATYKWLNPKAFGNFDEFLNRVIFSAARDYTAENVENVEYYDVYVSQTQETVKEIIMDHYYDEILNYFNNSINNL